MQARNAASAQHIIITVPFLYCLVRSELNKSRSA